MHDIVQDATDIGGSVVCLLVIRIVLIKTKAEAIEALQLISFTELMQFRVELTLEVMIACVCCVDH